MTNITTVGAASAPAFAWSYSHLKNAETCLKRYYHYQIAKDVVEPETEQLREGKALHHAFEMRIKYGTQLPLTWARHEPMLTKIINAPGQTYAEQKLALTSSFTPTGYFAKNCWFRSVSDCTKDDGLSALVLDWKTGKPAEDLTQLQLMSLTLFAVKPGLQRVKAALVFVNYDHVEPAEFTRSQVTGLWAEILPRVNMLAHARQTQEFPPRPSGLCKRYCAVVSCPHHGIGGR